MADRPNLGNTFGDLSSAIEATKGKAEDAIKRTEKLADAREAELRDAEAQEEQALTRETERGRRKKLIRDQGAGATDAETASVQSSSRALTEETGVLDANTSALERNAAARRADAAAAREQVTANRSAATVVQRQPVAERPAPTVVERAAVQPERATVVPPRPVEPIPTPTPRRPRTDAERQAERRTIEAEAARSAKPPDQGGYPLPGAFQGTRQPAIPQEELAQRAASARPVLIPRGTRDAFGQPVKGLPPVEPENFEARRKAFLSRKIEPLDGPEQDRLYREALGQEAFARQRSTVEAFAGPKKPLIEGEYGGTTFQANDEKAATKFLGANKKAAAQARKEEAKQLAAEEKEAAKAEADAEAAGAAPPRKPPAPRPVAVAPQPEEPDLTKPVAFAERDLGQQAAIIRGLTTTQLKTLEEIEAGQTEFSVRKKKTIDALKEAGLVTATSEPEPNYERIDQYGESYGKTGATPYTGAYTGVRRTPPVVQAPPPVEVPAAVKEVPTVEPFPVVKAPPPVVEPPPPVEVPAVVKETPVVEPAPVVQPPPGRNPLLEATGGFGFPQAAQQQAETQVEASARIAESKKAEADAVVAANEKEIASEEQLRASVAEPVRPAPLAHQVFAERYTNRSRTQIPPQEAEQIAYLTKPLTGEEDVAAAVSRAEQRRAEELAERDAKVAALSSSQRSTLRQIESGERTTFTRRSEQTLEGLREQGLITFQGGHERSFGGGKFQYYAQPTTSLTDPEQAKRRAERELAEARQLEAERAGDIRAAQAPARQAETQVEASAQIAESKKAEADAVVAANEKEIASNDAASASAVRFGRTSAYDKGWQGRQSETPILRGKEQVGVIRGAENVGVGGQEYTIYDTTSGREQATRAQPIASLKDAKAEAQQHYAAAPPVVTPPAPVEVAAPIKEVPVVEPFPVVKAPEPVVEPPAPVEVPAAVVETPVVTPPTQAQLAARKAADERRLEAQRAASVVRTDAETPEDFYNRELAARQTERHVPLTTTTGSLSDAVAATKAPTVEPPATVEVPTTARELPPVVEPATGKAPPPAVEPPATLEVPTTAREVAPAVEPVGAKAPPPAVEPPATLEVPTHATEAPPVIEPAAAKAPPPVVEPPATLEVPTTARELPPVIEPAAAKAPPPRVSPPAKPVGPAPQPTEAAAPEQLTAFAPPPPKKPPTPPPVAAGAGGGGEGPKRLISDEERELTIEQELAAARAQSNALVQRSVGAYASASTELTRHGALTAEFIQTLIRGEVTLQEFESQLGLTIGKFAGWAVAGGLVYGAYEAIKRLASGLTNTQSGVEQLKRSLGEKVNVPAAEEGLRKLATEVNVPIPEAAEAQFFSARVFHDQAQSLELASTALKAYKLDQVSVQDAVKSFGAVAVAFRVGPEQIAETFNQLDVGQLKFNARLQQTLPQMGRAAASWAAAGGSLKGLGDILIEINRATGGGGGTGGGNPATAILREPANLTRPESEQTLRKFGFEPREARQNIQAFNETVQRQVKEGKLSETDVQELAKAAGGGAGVGFRYLLPYFRLGRTNLPEEVTEATSKAAGSAAEDLSHKLSQADEQIKRLGIDFEVFGSHLGGGGITRSLTDFLSVLNTVIKAVGGAVDPFARLASTLSNLPGIIRVPLEAALAGYGIKRLATSRVGEAVGNLTGETKLFLKGTEDPAEEARVRAALVAQRSELKNLESEKLQLATQGRGPLRRTTERAATALERESALAPGPEATKEEQEAYAKRVESRQNALARSLDAQVANLDEQVAIEGEITAKKELVSTLEDRKIKTAERSLVAQEAGLYGPSQGLGRGGPLIAPNQRAAIEESERRTGNIILPPALRGGAVPVVEPEEVTTPPVATGAPRAGEALARSATTAGQAAREAQTLEVAAADSSSLFLLLENTATRAGSALSQAGSRIGGAATGLKNFFANLGVLGKGLALFVGADILGQLLGAPEHFEQETSRGVTLASPNSRADLEKAIEGAPKGKTVGNVLEESAQALVAGVQHPIALAELAGNAFGLGGQTHPAIFAVSRRVENEAEAKRRAKELQEGHLSFPGEGASHQQLEFAAGEERENVEQIEKPPSNEEDQKKVEGGIKKAEERVKLRLSQLQEFGKGKFGLENIEYIDLSQLAVFSAGYEGSGNQTSFEEFAKLSDEADKKILDLAKERADVYAKFAGAFGNAKEFQAAVGEAGSEIDQHIKDIQTEVQQSSERVSEARDALLKHIGEEEARRLIAGRPGANALAPLGAKTARATPPSLTGPFASPFGALQGFPAGLGADAKEEARETKQREEEERNYHEQVKHHDQLVARDRERLKALEVGKAEANEALFESYEAPGRARTEEAGAGQGRVAKAEIDLKHAREEEAEAVKLYGEDKLNWKVLDDSRKKVAEAAEQAAESEIAKVERTGQRELSEIPHYKKAARSEAEVSAARKNLDAIKTNPNLTPSKRAELLEDSQIKLNDALKADEERQYNEGKEFVQLESALQEARDYGNATALAADAKRKAARLLALAKTPQERLAALTEAEKANTDARKAQVETISRAGELKESTEPSTVAKDLTKLQTLKQQLPLVTHDERPKLQAEINNERRKYYEDKATEAEDEIKFLQHVDTISAGTAAERLKNVLKELKAHGAAPSKIRAVEQEIFDDLNLSGQDFNVGNIKLPTLYDARTLGARGAARPGVASAIFGQANATANLQQNNTITIQVSPHDQPEKVAEHTAKVLHRTLGQNARAHLRSAGLGR